MGTDGSSKAMAGRMSVLAWRTAAIGVAILTISLPLVVLWPLNAASTETKLIWLSATSNLPACISIVGIPKNIVVRHFAKQEAMITGHYQRYLTLIDITQSEPYFSRPYCGYSREWVRDASVKDDVFGLVQRPAQRFSIDNIAVMWLSGWGEPIVLELVTKDGVWSNCGRGSFGSQSAYLVVNLKLPKTGPT
jgi:hypothetical protein